MIRKKFKEITEFELPVDKLLDAALTYSNFILIKTGGAWILSGYTE